MLKRLRVSEAEHADTLERLKAKHAVEIFTLKCQHEARMQQVIAREQDRYEKLQRSHAEHIQSLFSQPPNDEGHESRASTPGRADARLPEAAAGKYFKEPQTPMAEETVLSVASHAVREAERAAQLGKDFIFFDIVMLPISALSAAAVGIRSHSGFYAYRALLLDLFLLLLHLFLVVFVAPDRKSVV